MKRDEEWLGRLDQLKKRFGINSDVVLASTVGISPAMLAHVRAGRRPLPLPARIRLLDKLGYAFTRDKLLEILPNEARAVLTEIDNRRHNKKMLKKGPRN
jgi:hypothetical protein